MLLQADEQRAEELMKLAQQDVKIAGNSTARWQPCTLTATTKWTKDDT